MNLPSWPGIAAGGADQTCRWGLCNRGRRWHMRMLHRNIRCPFQESGMPLSQPAERERLHTRAIEINGYRRADGHYDIEAHLTDVKSFGQTNYDRGYIEAGDPVHDMWLRLTVDETMHIHAVEAVSDKTPYADVPDARRPTSPAWSVCRSRQGSCGMRRTRSAGRSVARICGNCSSKWRPPRSRPSTLPKLGGRWRRRATGGQTRQRCVRQTDHREMGRREQDPQYLPGV